MTGLESKYFSVLPAKTDIMHVIAELGFGTVRDVKLFKFSSCTPAICIELQSQHGALNRIVLRGEQQNDLSVTEAVERSMEKEVFMLKTIRNLGLNAPEVLLDGRTFAIPGYTRDGARAGEFRFFLMEYVEGIAIDRRVRASSASERCKLLDKIAAIYARIHSVSNAQYGLMDRNGVANNGCSDFRDFVLGITANKAALVARLLSTTLADQVSRFCDTAITDLCDDIEQSDYRPQPRLVLYDGSAGNMLIHGDTISLIDMDLAGYFEPVTEFCAFIFPLKSLLLETGNQRRYWDHFLDSYVQHGGLVPPTQLMVRLLHMMFINILLHQLVYCKESRGPDKQSQVGQLVATISHMLTARPKRIEDVVSLIK